MINRRRAMGGVFPAGYKRVAYIESSGQQWVNTGMTVRDTVSYLSVSVGMTILSNSGEYDIAGSGGGDTPTMGGNGGYYWTWAKGGSSWKPIPHDDDFHYVEYTFFNPQNRRLVIDDIIQNAGYSNTFTGGSSLNLYLFASSPNRFPIKAKVQSITIEKDGIIYRTFIPCINPNGVVGLFDTTNKVFYTTESNVPFIAGPVV